MKFLTDTDMFRLACKGEKKWGLLISFDGDEDEELEKAAPYLKYSGDTKDYGALLRVRVDGVGYLLFDTEEEMLNIYNQTVGEDGPAKLNPYNGPARVYALTCSPEGQLLNENT